jgi:hypothetical protein
MRPSQYQATQSLQGETSYKMHTFSCTPSVADEAVDVVDAFVGPAVHAVDDHDAWLVLPDSIS